MRATTSLQAPARASFDNALREYNKRIGIDPYSSAAASVVGLADVHKPADISNALKSMLADLHRSQSGTSKLDTAVGKVLDVLLLFTMIGGEIAAVSVCSDFPRAYLMLTLSLQQVPGGKGVFVAFGILLKVQIYAHAECQYLTSSIV